MAILEDGAIRQIGRPVEIYDHPATTYVARFLDNPIMNILPVQATSAGFETAAGALQVVVGAQAGVVEMGLRPEDLRVSAWEGGADVPAPVSEVEPLGGYTVVTLTAGTQSLRAMLRGQPDIRVGALVGLGSDPERVMYFGAGGDALPKSAAPSLGGDRI